MIHSVRTGTRVRLHSSGQSDSVPTTHTEPDPHWTAPDHLHWKRKETSRQESAPSSSCSEARRQGRSLALLFWFNVSDGQILVVLVAGTGDRRGGRVRSVSPAWRRRQNCPFADPWPLTSGFWTSGPTCSCISSYLYYWTPSPSHELIILVSGTDPGPWLDPVTHVTVHQ